MFSKKSKSIKELEDTISKLEQELEEARELALDQHMELQFRDWEEEKNNPIYIEMTPE
ncbi:TPA: hypothetical protein ROX88_001153 [Bacillus pseudomycoides]|nr:hypothetical protein [Bacillus pseudomycoides]